MSYSTVCRYESVYGTQKAVKSEDTIHNADHPEYDCDTDITDPEIQSETDVGV